MWPSNKKKQWQRGNEKFVHALKSCFIFFKFCKSRFQNLFLLLFHISLKENEIDNFTYFYLKLFFYVKQ